MNARAYFTILRPVRTLVVALVYLGFVFVWLHTLFRAPRQEMFLLALALIGPAIVGTLLLGPLHEVMHRSVFPLLPDARRQLRRWHLRALATVSVLFLIPAKLLLTDIPVVALYGLIIAALSIPLLNNRRRSWGAVRPQFVLLILSGIVLTATARPLLISLCQEAPWAVLGAGLGSAHACIRTGFSQSFVRDRWRDPVLYCFQSVMPFVSRGMILHSQAQIRQLSQERSTRAVREWDLSEVGTSLRNWARVIHHTRFGHRGRFGHLISAGLTTAGILPFCVALIYGMEKLSGKTTTLPQLCELILTAGTINGRIDNPLSVVVFAILPLLAFTSACLAAMQSSISAYPLPVSRLHLASCLFLNAHRSGATILTISLLSTVLCWSALSLIAGVPFEISLLARPLAAYLILPSAITLSLSTYFIHRRLWRYLASAGMCIGYIVAIYAAVFTYTAAFLSPLGLLACAAATAGSGCISWGILRRYYQRCDLNNAGTWLRQLGIGLT